MPLFLSLHLLLGLSHPIFPHLSSVPILFSGHLFLLHYLCISFLPFSFSTRSQFSHDGLLPSFPDFLYLGIESSYALWKMSFKISQISSVPLPLRAVFHRAPIDELFEGLEVILPEIQGPDFILGLTFIPQDVNSTSALSLQPGLPPVLMLLINLCCSGKNKVKE